MQIFKAISFLLMSTATLRKHFYLSKYIFLASNNGQSRRFDDAAL